MKKATGPTLYVLLAILVIGGIIFLLKNRSASAEDKALLDTPAPRPGSPNFGPLDDKYIIGKSGANVKAPGK